MKVALAGTSAAETALLTELLPRVPAELLWLAKDARAAIARCRAQPADVLVVSLGPGVDGSMLIRDAAVAGLSPVVVLSSDPSRDVHAVYAALAAGAVDVATSPRSASDAEATALVTKLRRLGNVRTAPRTRTLPGRTVLALAASTGGPAALAAVLGDLPRELPWPVLLAQHMDEDFLSGLAEWLGATSGRRVELAEEGAALEAGRILLVRSDAQPSVERPGRVRYHPLDPANPFHPCIDALFGSLARVTTIRGVAALLTGMGADGAAGLLSLRRAGWTTLAQDAATSVVFGMPKAAADLGAATEVLPLDRVARGVLAALRRLTDEVTP